MDIELERLIKQLGQSLYNRGVSELAKEWNTLIIDARYDGRGGVLAKIRALDHYNKFKPLKSDNTIDMLLIALDSCRNVAGSTWYGLLMTVSASMECSIDFNYDPNCEEDPAFFDG